MQAQQSEELDLSLHDIASIKSVELLHFFENLILSDIWMTHDTLRKRQFSTQANMKEGNIKNKGTQGKISFCLSSKCFIIQYLSRF